MSLTTFYGPYPREALLTHCKSAERMGVFKLIGNAATLATALAVPPNVTPAVYFCFSEVASKSKGMTGLFMQDVSVSINAVIWAKNYAQQTAGAAAVADMTALIRPLREELLGWVAGEGFTRLLLDAQRDEFYKDGYLVVQEVYKSTYRIQVPS